MKQVPKLDGGTFIYEAVIEQVTKLCKELMQIPMAIGFQANHLGAKSRTKSPLTLIHSEDTDTDNSDNDTNGSAPMSRPRANSDTRADIRYLNSNAAIYKLTSLDNPKFNSNQNQHASKTLSGIDNIQDNQHSFMKKFEEIGVIPNDSESSEGSLRGDSPGPLRGYPLSILRRPSSASRAERHFYTRDRASSLPLLNVRRCRTPTPSSGSLVAASDIRAPARSKSLNGGSATTGAFGRRDKLFSDYQRISPVDRQLASKDVVVRRKQSPISQYQMNKNEILISYNRDAENLVKRQANIYTTADAQNKHPSSDSSDSPKADEQQNVTRILELKTNTDNEFPVIRNGDAGTRSFRKEGNSKQLNTSFDNSFEVEQDNSRGNAHQRLTPKRLLPKVPSTQICSQHNRSPDTKGDISHINKPRDGNFLQTQAIPNGDRIGDEKDEEPSAEQLAALRSTTKDQKSDTEPKEFRLHNETDNDIDIGRLNKTHGRTGVLKIGSDKENKKNTKETTAKGCSTSDTQENKQTANATSPNTSELDIDEIKFNENVRTARRDIIDKLRSKYALPRCDIDSASGTYSAESELSKSDNCMQNKETENVDKSTATTVKENMKTEISDITEAMLKNGQGLKHVSLSNSMERHSPVMSIAGLKRYKSTSNLSKLESFDKATSKFNDEKNGTMGSCENPEVDKNNANNTINLEKDNKTEDNESNGKTDKLCKSLTFETISSVVSQNLLDRQGLLRSASVENVDSYKLIDTLSSSGQLSETSNSKLKESGISTMSFNDLSLNTTEELTGTDLNNTHDETFCRDGARHPTSSSDNGFDSSEGFGNSEDSLDDLDTHSGNSADYKKNNSKEKTSVFSPNLYPAKLIHIDKSFETSVAKLKPESNNDHTHDELSKVKGQQYETKSKLNDLKKYTTVRSAVEQIETTIFPRSRPEKRTLKQFKENSMERKIHVRSRSASASRNPASVYCDFLPHAAKALYPRTRFGSASESIQPGVSMSSAFSSVKKSRSIEADLNKICQEETAESIRREWIHRRSASASKLRKTDEKMPAVQVSSIFKFDKSYLLPSRNLRSRFNGIVSLQNGRFVVLDELQSCLYLLTAEFRVVSESSLKFIPCGICATGSNSFAVAFPYKSLIRVFYVVKDRVTHTRDIAISCAEWITDINHRKGRIHVLCKAGHIHMLGITGREEGSVDTGVTGKLQVNEAGNRFYIHRERNITRFNHKGEVISTKSDVSASCIMLYNDKLYIADSDRKRIITLSERGDTRDLLSNDTGPVSAVCFSPTGDQMFVCHYSDDMDDESTRRISIFTKRAN